MRKTLLSIIFLVILLLVPTMTIAAEGDVAQVGTEKFQSIEVALNAAMGTENEVTLLKDATLAGTYQVTDKLTINLGGFEITGDSPVFEIVGGELNVIGKGTIKENNPYYAPIFVRGSGVSTDTNYSVVNIKNGVTLEGWSGIIVKGPTDTSENAYGVVINCEGSTINSVYDASNYAGHGIYINGNVKNQENPVKINVTSTSITSKGTGIYAAGYGVWNFTDTTINADQIGLGIKSGTVELNNVVVEANGAFAQPVGNGNGITSTGAAIQIEEYKNYAGKINLTINGGSYTSKNNSALLEYTTSVDGVTFLEEININGGTFASAEGKDVITLSDSFKGTITEGFIKGGTFSTDVGSYVAPYHVCEATGSNYTVYKLHDITVNSSEGGTASSALIRAKEGTHIGLDVKPDDGYEFREVIVTDTLGNILFTTVNQYFIMPDSEVIVKVVFGKETPKIEVSETVEDAEKAEEIIYDSLIEDERFDEIIDNNTVQIKIEVTEDKIDEIRKEEIEKALKEEIKVAKYLDITIAVKEKETGVLVDTIDELKEKIRFSVAIPEDLPEVAEGFARKYYIIRNHNGVVEYLDAVLSEDGKTLYFETDKFSAYALAYSDEETTGSVEGETMEEPKTDESVVEDSKSEETNTNNIPNTGDNIVLYVLLAIVAICGIIVAKKVNTKKNKH